MHKTMRLLLVMIGLFSPIIVCAEGLAQAADIATRQVHLRSLAASCAACHGTNGNSSGITPNISNIYKPYFVSQMLAFKSGERAATVMHHHAKGLTTQEIEDLAEYFSKQSRQPVHAIANQHLSESYSN